MRPVTLPLLLAMLGLYASPADTNAQCSPIQPLRVHIVADNSSSVRRKLGDYEGEMQRWLTGLGEVLRPGDSVYVYPLLRPARETLRPLAVAAVHRDEPYPRVSQSDLARMARALVADGSNKTDLAGTLEALRGALISAAQTCRIALLVTDGALAPLQSGQYRSDALRALRHEVARWPAMRVPLVVMGVSPGENRGFDTTYQWRSGGEMEARLAHWGGDRLLDEVFGKFLDWRNDLGRLSETVYLEPGSPFDGMQAADELPAEGIASSYILYRLQNDAGERDDPYLSCGTRIRDEHHVITAAGPGECLHHLIGHDRRLPPGLWKAVSAARWLSSSTLSADAIPRPLRSPAQVAITDEGDQASQSCTSLTARRHLIETGWASDPGGPMIRVIMDSEEPERSDTLLLTRIPATSCYAVPNPSSLTYRTLEADSVSLRFGFWDGESMTNPNAADFERVPGQPFWDETSINHLIGLRVVGLDLWFVRGYVTLPAAVRRPALHIGTRTIVLREEPSGTKCNRMEYGRRCFRFAMVLSDPPEPRAALTTLESRGAAADLVPFVLDVDGPAWNSLGMAISGLQLLLAVILAPVLAIIGVFGRAWLRSRSFIGGGKHPASPTLARIVYFSWLVFALLLPAAEIWIVASEVDAVSDDLLPALVKGALSVAVCLIPQWLPRVLLGGET